MSRNWRGGLLALGWTVMAGLFTGCDLCSGSNDKTTSSATANLSAPEPARFGAPQQPGISPEAARLMAGARELAGASAADSDPSAVQAGRIIFDGAGRGTGSPAPVLAGKPLVVRAGMAIDTDGHSTGYDSRINPDPHRQKNTSFRYGDGSSLNPAQVPYVVVPSNYQYLLGDLVDVSYGGRTVRAVVGDCGPDFGEGSVALAEQLGIPSSGVSGGISRGVTYSFYPGSGRRFSGPLELQQALSGSTDQKLASL